jgi:rod shape determining protein RodA
MPLKKYLSSFKNFDFILLAAVMLLIFFGLAAIYSIAISSEQPDFLNFKKQIIFAVIGLVCLVFFSMVDSRIFHDYSYIIFGAAVLFLVAVLFFGKTVSGTTGWFVIAGINFQPVELAKVGLIIILSWYLGNHLGSLKDLKSFLVTGFIAGLLFILVMLQPDFGSAMILFLIWLAMVIFAKVNKKYLFVLFLILVILFGFAWSIFFQDYQKDRIMTFFNPQADPYDRGYHVRQAMIAIGAGGFFGRGLGFGSQSQLKFIPASQTDFIFAVISEELGFLGVGLVLFFWALIFYRLARAAKITKDSFSLFFILGVSALFFSQVIINIGMNIGLLPVTGISLPFLSYGGSFLVSSMALVGIVEGMIIKNKSSL